ncbi:MAG TPA: PD-(D/E)XK nuclease family protein [Casimicrobiaceae bacterium]
MSASAVDAALAAGSWVVTPGERLARELAIAFDSRERGSGKAVWPTPRAVSWNAWLDRLWLGALAGGAFARPPTLLARATATELWRGVIDEAAPSLLSVWGAARGAARAWHTFHAWRRSTNEPLPGDASGDAPGGTDCDAFLRWCTAYRARLEALAAIDRAGLPDLLARHAGARWLAEFAQVVLYAFDALTPQQERFIAAIGAAGVTVVRVAGEAAPAVTRERAAFASPREELAQALFAARGVVESDGAATVAIVVADLEKRRDGVEALAEEILCPEHLERYAPGAARPYAISLGRALASVPIVATALDLIALAAGGEIDALRAARIVRAPYLPDADARGAQRAAVELRWRASRRLRVDFADVVTALREVEPELALRWSAVPRPAAPAQLPRDWARAWSAWLAALGWPGTRMLTSAEWQARDAWTELLGAFAALGSATGRIRADAALSRLSELATEQLFQPQAPIAPIRILGVEEALGLVFDAARLVGFDDEQWPPPARPDPWLPLAWQRARGIPEATPATALARTRRATAQLAAIAPRIVVSHASTVEGSERSASLLFAQWPEAAAAPGDDTRSIALWRARQVDAVVDRCAPPVRSGSRLRGGAGAIESQSACPFQAFARYRLGVAAAPELGAGIGALQRGALLHAALAAFWAETRSSATLATLSPEALAAKVESAAKAGVAQLDAATRAGLPALIVDGERRRLATTLHAWIEHCERSRPPFEVVACEHAVDVAIEGVALRFRIDRIDALQGGRWAIVDYKSGGVKAPRNWFDARPQGTQLAAYAVAAPAIELEGTPPPGVGALAYAQVKAGELRVSGIAADTALWPALQDAGSARGEPTTWDDALDALAGGVAALVRELREGCAAVSPSDREVCRTCDLKPLCRIRDLGDGTDDDSDAMVDGRGAGGAEGAERAGGDT